MKNVKIPEQLLIQTIRFLEDLKMAGIYNDLRDDWQSLYDAFTKKQASLSLRNDYGKIICAKDDNARFDARMQYLQNKRNLETYY
jgi:hypothetical protein